ncbi:hypothetical protein MTBSS4_280040 [Magnetospirillum sp. SS-4]|nr:hypothetical protein MTBSS4_280040 [Magnetospirillum sp. SS-4]
MKMLQILLTVKTQYSKYYTERRGNIGLFDAGNFGALTIVCIKLYSTYLNQFKITNINLISTKSNTNSKPQSKTLTRF